MNNNQLSTFFFVALMMMIFSGSFPGIFPLIVVYFIVRSILSGQEEQRRRRGGDDYDRRNREQHRRDRRYENQRDSRRRQQDLQMQRQEELRRQQERERQRRASKPRPKPRPRNNPYKQSGVKKFKEYDYAGAIEDFEKALEIDSTDVAVHFNIACCYSLNEDKDKAFYHLSKAVALGFKDFQKIQEHDALAYLRIQDEFETFKQNGYRTVNMGGNNPAPQATTQNTDLLEQLNKLQELRERGVLTEEEFALQKQKILR